MPICPKCGKMISNKKYSRHLARHGQKHKHPPGPLPPSSDNIYQKL